MRPSRGTSRVVRVGVVAFAIAGCGPVRTATGPCELQVFADAHQQIEELALPYAVDLGADPIDVAPLFPEKLTQTPFGHASAYTRRSATRSKRIAVY